MSTNKPQASDGHSALVESYFDRFAEDWSDLYDTVREVNDLVLARRQEIAVDFLCTQLAPAADVRVLDAGCGAGLASFDLVRRGFYVHGFDVSEKMLEHCRRRFAKAGIGADRYRFTRTELMDDPFEPGSFDGIVALGFIQYLPDEGAALRVLHGALKPGGVLVVTGPTLNKISNYLGLLRRLKRLKSGVKRMLGRKSSDDGNPHRVVREISRHTYTPERFRALLEEAGFEMLRWEGHGFAGFPVLRRYLKFQGELFLHRSLSRLARVLPIGRWGNDLVVLARKPA
jgi:SAM-dependent methyltransferase